MVRRFIPSLHYTDLRPPDKARDSVMVRRFIPSLHYTDPRPPDKARDSVMVRRFIPSLHYTDLRPPDKARDSVMVRRFIPSLHYTDLRPPDKARDSVMVRRFIPSLHYTDLRPPDKARDSVMVRRFIPSLHYTDLRPPDKARDSVMVRRFIPSLHYTDLRPPDKARDSVMVRRFIPSLHYTDLRPPDKARDSVMVRRFIPSLHYTDLRPPDKARDSVMVRRFIPSLHYTDLRPPDKARDSVMQQEHISFPSDPKFVIEEKEPYLGRITGSASVDTLVRVGLEKQHGLSPEARMTVVDRFTACASDELNVSQGQTVYMLYTEQEWMYVLMEDGSEGFIPRSFAKPCQSPALSKRVPPTPLSQTRRVLPPGGTDDEGNDGDQSNSPTNSSSQVGGFPDASMPEEDSREAPLQASAPASDCEGQQGSNASDQEGRNRADVLPFERRAQGKRVVMFSYDVQQESDVRVTSGEVVTLFNADDKDWLWIRRSGGGEGFVPRRFLCRLPDDFRIKDKSLSGFQPATKKPPVPNHHRSWSMTDPPVSWPAFLKPPPPPPPPQPPAQTAAQPSSGVYNVPRAAAVHSATRQRPHSSMGFPVSSSASVSSQQPPSVPLNSRQNVPRYREHGYREQSHSSLSMMSKFSQSHGSLPQAVSSEQNFSATSVRTRAQRPHSSMGYPLSSSGGVNQHHPPPSFPGAQQSQFSSFPGSQRMQDSVSHASKSAWTAEASGTAGTVSNSGVSVSAPPGHVPFSDCAAGLRGHQSAARFEETSSALTAGLRGHQSAARFEETSSALTAGLRGHQSAARFEETSSALTAGLRGHQSAARFEETSSALTAGRARFSGPPPPPSFPPSSAPSSVPHLASLPLKGPQSSPSHASPPSSPVDPPPLPPSSAHPRSPPANHNVRSNNITNRFSSAQPGQTTPPPQLTWSLNHSQDGRRPTLMHQLSAPEPPVSHDLSSTNTSRDGQGRYPPHQPTNDTGTDVRLQSVSSPHSRRELGEIGRSKSSSQFPEPPVPNSVTELMTVHKFSSRGVDDISVSSDEVVYGDLDKQPERDWLWVYSPKLQRHGYIPRSNVRLPGNAGDLRSDSVARV
ncbi:hypothetical protein ACOMHN_007824 [Nucella lapillus]